MVVFCEKNQQQPTWNWQEMLGADTSPLLVNSRLPSACRTSVPTAQSFSFLPVPSTLCEGCMVTARLLGGVHFVPVVGLL